MKKRSTHQAGQWSLVLALCCLSLSGMAHLKVYLNTNAIADPEKKDTAASGLTVSHKSDYEITVSGKVTGEFGEGIPGVSVILKGTSMGTVTDFEGKYVINIPDEYEQGILVFSFIGYETTEETIGGRIVIDVQLTEDIHTLDEVVVIGYQSVKKKDITGATSIVSPDDANQVSASSLAESIQGLAAGVTVRNAGAPGSDAAIEIRGAYSFLNTSPLYVIDGMIADANPTINTNDIESVQILKDASAAAIYGSRAANGVVIITTKKGSDGPAKISFSAKYGIQQLPEMYDVMNNTEFAAMQRTQYENSGLQPPSSVSTAFDPSVNTDWYDEGTRTGNIQDYNMTVSGGSSSGQYLLSGSYFKNKGVLLATGFERGAFRINAESRKGRVTFGENLVLTYSSYDEPGMGNPFYDMPQLLPVIPVRGGDYITGSNPDGWGIGTTDAVTYAWNPVAVSNINSRESRFAKLVGNAYMDVEITEWLTYRANAGAEASFDHIRTMRRDGEWHFNQPAAPTSITEDRSQFTSFLFEHTLNFNKTVGIHDLNGVIGYSQQHFKRAGSSAGRTDLQSFNGQYLNTIRSATGDAVADGVTDVDYLIYGYLGRLNYTYDSRYLLTLTGRYDVDSRFGEDHRSEFFPSVALGWRVTEEDFFDVPWISDLKLRGSYGKLGISTVESWDRIGFLNSNPRAIFGPSEEPNVGATQARLANPDLRWEKRTSRNIGMDVSLLDHRVSVSIEAYNSLSEDVLVYLPVAWYLGNLGGEPAVNAASIRNSGVELTATYRSIEGPLKWNVSANMTTINNTVEDVGNRGEGIDYIQTGITRTQVGRSIGEWYLLQTDGLFRSQAEIDNYTHEGDPIQPFAQPGDIRFVDINDDGEINQDDRTFVGSPWPTLQSGMQFGASYKQFSLNFQLVGIFGYEVLNGVRQVLDSYQNTNFRRDIDPWSLENPNGADPRIGVAVNDPGLIDNARLESDRWLEKGSYVRMRNIEIGYTLPSDVLSKLHVSSARLYVSAQNLFTITKYSGPDPDVTGTGILERGFDAGNWPSSRVLSVGFQCEF